LYYFRKQKKDELNDLPNLDIANVVIKQEPEDDAYMENMENMLNMENMENTEIRTYEYVDVEISFV